MSSDQQILMLATALLGAAGVAQLRDILNRQADASVQVLPAPEPIKEA